MIQLLRALGRPHDPHLFVGTVLGYMQLGPKIGESKVLIIRGGTIFYWDDPPLPKLPSNTSSIGRAERDLKRRGVRSGRVRGIQPDIGWSPFEGGRPVKVHCC